MSNHPSGNTSVQLDPDPVQTVKDVDIERMIVEHLSPIPSIRSVICMEKEHGTWHLLIIHDSDSLWDVLDPVVGRIIEIEGRARALHLEPLFARAPDERKLPPDAKIILKR